jgi:hypothetical protein
MTVHVDRLVKAHERPAHLVTIPSDLSNWIKQAQERDVLDVPAPAAQIPQGALASEIILAPSDQIPAQEVAGSPKVTQKQRSAKEREEETWKIDHIVDRIERKDGSRQYRVRFDGFPDPNEDLWYEEEDLRSQGNGKLIDEFDQARDREEIQKRLGAKPDSAGKRQSSRLRARHYY